MKLIMPVESIVQKKGGVIIYDPNKNEILDQYIHDKEWGGYRVGWRGGKLYNDYLIATDWTDLHFFNWKKWEYERTFKKDSFNDLHYVEVFDDKLYIVNTGIDAIEVFDDPLDPKHKETIFMFKRFKNLFKNRKIDKDVKYNEMYKVKPHVAHPNCICKTDKHLFVTCFQKRQSSETGEIVCLNTGEKLTKRPFSCHDGNFHNGNFYLSNTRRSTILVFNNIDEKKLPTQPDEKISLRKKGWWRGMVLQDQTAYVFASFYSKNERPALMAIVNLKKKKCKLVTMPVKDNIHWDTIYQPNILEP